MLDIEPVVFKAIRHVRPKFSCRACEKIVQAPAPDKAIVRGKASFRMIGHIIVSKFDHHLPLYRQAEMMAAQGVRSVPNATSKTRSRRSENASPSRSQNPSRDVHAVSRRPDDLQPDCVYDTVKLDASDNNRLAARLPCAFAHAARSCLV